MFHKNESRHFVEICEKLGYQFKRRRLLLQALTRRTALNEGKQRADIGDYQRLEFLGDKVINMVISDILFEYHPDWNEGELTRATASFVNNNGPLAKVAKKLGLSAYLIVGTGEERRGVSERVKVLSDATEALFGAVFLDSGRDYALIRRLVMKHWESLGLVPKEKADEDSEHQKFTAKPEDTIDKALIEAVEDDDVHKVIRSLELGANPNLGYQTYDDYGETLGEPYGISLLMLAIQQQSKEIVVALLEKGAAPNWRGTYELVDMNPPRKNCTAWQLSTHKSDIERIETQYSALHWLILLDKCWPTTTISEFIMLLQKFGADPTLVDYKGRTPVMCVQRRRGYLTSDDRKALIRLLEKPFKKAPPTPAQLSAAITQTITETWSSIIAEL